MLTLTLCGQSLLAAEKLESGTPVGERPGPYAFNIATGPERGQQFCHICETGKQPAIIVFAQKESEPLADLLKKLDGVASLTPEDGEIRAWTTFLGEKFTMKQLSGWAKKASLKNVVVGAIDDPLGPPTYRLSEKAEVTVLLFVGEKVVANFAFAEDELDAKATEKVLKAVPMLKK